VKSPVFCNWALTPGALGISSHHGSVSDDPAKPIFEGPTGDGSEISAFTTWDV